MSFNVTDHPADAQASREWFQVVVLKALFVFAVLTFAYVVLRRPRGKPLEMAPTSKTSVMSLSAVAYTYGPKSTGSNFTNVPFFPTDAYPDSLPTPTEPLPSHSTGQTNYDPWSDPLPIEYYY